MKRFNFSWTVFLHARTVKDVPVEPDTSGTAIWK